MHLNLYLGDLVLKDRENAIHSNRVCVLFCSSQKSQQQKAYIYIFFYLFLSNGS